MDGLERASIPSVIYDRDMRLITNDEKLTAAGKAKRFLKESEQISSGTGMPADKTKLLIRLIRERHRLMDKT